MNSPTGRWWATIPLSVLAAAVLAACSASEPPAEIAEELEGVFVAAEETPSDVVMHRGGPTRTGFYDTTGVLEEPAVKWTFQADRKIATSPAVLEDRVLFGSDDGSLYALDLETGEELWRFEAGGRRIRSSPLVADGVVYFGNDAGMLHALDVETGDQIWSFEANRAIMGSPVLAGGTVYFGTNENNFYALEARTGLMNWQKDLQQDVRTVEIYSAPAILGDLVYVVSGLHGFTAPSVFNAIDRQSGDIVWSLELEGTVVDAPAVTDDTVLVSTHGSNVDGWVYAIDLETRQPRWVFQPENRRTRIRTAPTIAEDLVLVGDSEGRLTAIDFDTGEVEWTFESDAEFFTSLTVADLLVYFGDVDGAIVAVDLLTGVERWMFQTDLSSSAPTNCQHHITCGTFSPVVDSGSLYMGNPAGYFYALEYSTSTGGAN